ncbi:heavy-metal-associated domain-containing protein [Leifsonia aquatica]|uniref:Heavy metal-associated domain protein n=2 Tax=Leifsonia aquatica TaxID=144185 RepID=U2RWT9_LEIAQ|nr:heavy-metal-associated domain-containing protein [Leifsonia aquatica]ERK73236.1 heavy metal-associated domain protein [Leifsonia aquatica ATCC 14665]MBB2969268.1 copper ion binding protein [Leifsonia aquatica]MBN9630536.1 heavy-metal-associated domain-containing protein [Actinomycetota bacterium]
MATQNFQDLGLQDANSGCACCAPAHAKADLDVVNASSASPVNALATQFLVEGMTCEHCVRSVTEEVSAIEGVSGVDIDLKAGGVSTVVVSSESPVDPARVREAVEEAGYSLAGVS